MTEINIRIERDNNTYKLPENNIVALSLTQI